MSLLDYFKGPEKPGEQHGSLVGNLVHEAYDFCKHETQAVKTLAGNAKNAALHDLHIVENGATVVGHACMNEIKQEAHAIANGAAVFRHEAAVAGHAVQQFGQQHPWLKNMTIDLAAGTAAVAAVGLGSFTGPGALVIGGATGIEVSVLLHKLAGDKITGGTVVNGAIDGLSGGVAGMLEKFAAEQLTKVGARTAIESGLGRVGLQNFEKFASNILIKGAHDLHLSPEALVELSRKAVRIERALGHGSNFLRTQLYGNLGNGALRTGTQVMHLNDVASTAVNFLKQQR